MTDFKALVEALASAKADFIVVGGVAAAVHGSTHATTDLDVVYSRATDNLARIHQALTPYKPYLRGLPPGLPFVWEVGTLRNGLNFTLITALGEIDLLGEITGGGGYDALVSHSVELEVYGHRVRCLDLETLIRVKRAAGRPKDLIRLGELAALLEEAKKKG